MGTSYVNVTSNCNSKIDKPKNRNYSETGNNANCGNYEQSQPTLEPLSVTEQGFSIWATFPNREPELLRHTFFIRHRCSYFERMSQRLKQELYRKKNLKGKVPQWIKTIEERITRLTRTIRHLTKFINFKKTGIFIRHQMNTNVTK